MTIWYVARGAGLSALVLLTVSTCLGTLMAGRAANRADGRVVAQYVHRFVASLALGVLGVHITAILADSYAHAGWLGALVPFSSEYRPLWIGLGSVATYLVLLVAATGFLRRRLAGSPRAAGAWRVLHGSAYAAWALSMLHGLRAGSDTGLPWVRWIYLGCLAAMVASVTVRAITSTAERTPLPVVAR